MKVTAFVGSARKKHTYNATEKFLQKLQSLGDIEYEIVSLSDYDLKICKGCMLCLNKGEELCPLKDDRDKLIEKMNNSDGIIFSSPNYSFNVSGLMKIFLDRLGFIFHRPRFFGKACTSIVVQGFYRGNKIIDYFNFLGKGLGFNVVNGSCINSLEPMTEKDQKRFDSIISKHSKRFYSTLIKKEYPIPTLFQLMIFRMARTSVKLLLDENWRDYTHYKNNGWFGSNYYYPAQLNPVRKLAGNFFDFMFTRIYGKKVRTEQV
ncbi:MAG: flavodoxin family protein [Bacteroidia bacterium]|nr:flavodoxin family protein [Bacteroidia bacterium]